MTDVLLLHAHCHGHPAFVVSYDGGHSGWCAKCGFQTGVHRSRELAKAAWPVRRAAPVPVPRVEEPAPEVEASEPVVRQRAPLPAVGTRFGRLTVIDGSPNDGPRRAMCRCDCGAEKLVAVQSLAVGAVRSCGCLARENGARLGDAMRGPWKRENKVAEK